MDDRALFALALDVALRPELLLALHRAVNLHLLVDYDGTLVPLSDRPADAAPDTALLATLQTLLARPGLRITVVSSRDRATLTRWFDGVGVACCAENGAWRSDAARVWQRRVDSSDAWVALVRPALERFAAERRGAAVEVRESTLALHHRAVDVAGKAAWIGTLRGRLEPLVRHADVTVEVTRRAVELRPRAFSRRVVVLDALASRARGEELIAVGDDAPDEDMYSALRGAGTALHVGAGPTRAQWKLADVWALRRLLVALGSPDIMYR